MHDDFQIDPFSFHVYRGPDAASVAIFLGDYDKLLEEQELPVGCTLIHAKVVAATLAAKYQNIHRFRLYEFIKDINFAELVA